jgi:uncharacterized protein (DUF885 family)
VADVDALIRDLIDALAAGDPVTATSLGMTQGMDRLPSYSAAALRSRAAAMHDSLAALQARADAAGDVGEAVDAVAGVLIARRVLRDLEVRRLPQCQPSLYLDDLQGLLMLMTREIAPVDERVHALEGRLGAVQGLFEEARANLDPELPPVIVDSALDYAEGLHELVGATVREFAREAGHEGQLDDASRAAEQALAGFAAFLRDDRRPAAGGSGAAGREVLLDILRYEHVLPETPEQISAVGRRMVDETREAMVAQAAAMGFDDVEAAVAHVSRDHPSAGELLAGYRAAVAAARAYVVDHDLVTLAEGEELVVDPTPAYLRSILPFAGYEPPGPFEERQRGIYWVTLPEAGTSEADLEEALTGHPAASQPTVGVHEAYPGHHVQLTRANRAPTLARRVGHAPMGGTLLVEGWAFYCEELMEREGFLASPSVRLMRLNDQIWRAARVVIDMELHLGAMTFSEAVTMLADTAHMSVRGAELECRRYLEEPGQPMSYLVGKREVMALAADYAGRRTSSLKTFHDELLDWGSLPPALIRWGMGLGPRPPLL